MKFKVEIEGGLWGNCECIPMTWQPRHGHDTRFYGGVVDTLADAWGKVMEACMQWYPEVGVTNFDQDSWRVEFDGKTLALITPE